jgi:hypothetical protein
VQALASITENLSAGCVFPAVVRAPLIDPINT